MGVGGSVCLMRFRKAGGASAKKRKKVRKQKRVCVCLALMFISIIKGYGGRANSSQASLCVCFLCPKSFYGVIFEDCEANLFVVLKQAIGKCLVKSTEIGILCQIIL